MQLRFQDLCDIGVEFGENEGTIHKTGFKQDQETWLCRTQLEEFFFFHLGLIFLLLKVKCLNSVNKQTPGNYG